MADTTHESKEHPKAGPIHATPASTTAGGQPRLLTIPQEIRNSIYAYVFANPHPSTQEPEKGLPRKKDDSVNMVTVPASVKLSDASPPSLDANLPCRGLFTEMKGMRAAAYDAYWSENRFITTNVKGAEGYCNTWGKILPSFPLSKPAPPTFPNLSESDIKRIQHWSLPLEQGHCLHADLVQGDWKFWVLAKDYEANPPARLETHGHSVSWNGGIMEKVIVQIGRRWADIRDLNECLAHGRSITEFMGYGVYVVHDNGETVLREN